MSILTIEQYQQDADCPELVHGTTIIQPKDANYMNAEEHSYYLAYGNTTH